MTQTKKHIIEVHHLSKLYNLGIIGSHTLRETIDRAWLKFRDRSSQLAPPNSHGGRQGPYPNSMWALKDVSFNVDAGEIIGIVGNNGCGKSTLLKILSRITEPSSGHAIIRGRVSSLLEVGTGFHGELSGRENIYLNGAILGMRKREIDRQFDQIVDFSEIGQFIDTPVKRYSSGMYVRLAFAVAAHLNQQVLMIDEVLAVGDNAFQKKCLEKTEKIAGNGRTILFVSHDMDAIERICHKCIYMADGEIVNVGKPREIISEYKNVIKVVAA